MPTIRRHDDDSFECSLKSPTGIFSIWIATYNCEITFGLEAPNGKTDIHTHISCYDIDDIDDCTATLTRYIHQITDNKAILYFDDYDVNEYDWIEHERLKERNKAKA